MLISKNHLRQKEKIYVFLNFKKIIENLRQTFFLMLIHKFAIFGVCKKILIFSFQL